MAWNRSSENGEAASSPLQKRSECRFAVKGTVAWGLVLVVAAIAAWWLWPSGESAGETPLPQKEGLIKEVKPQVATNPVVVATNALPLAMKRDHSELSREDLLKKVPPWAYSVEDRKRVDPGYAKRHEKFLERQAKNPWKTFADNALAALMFNTGIGLNMPRFNPQFKDAFLKSLKTPIIPSHDDPPELQEQKRQMNETKIWLKQQMDEGKDIVQILNDEYDKQKKIVGLRNSLRQELFALEKTAKSVQDVEDYVTAANKMIEDAGGTAKLTFPTFITKIRLEREAAKANEENR